MDKAQVTPKVRLETDLRSNEISRLDDSQLIAWSRPRSSQYGREKEDSVNSPFVFVFSAHPPTRTKIQGLGQPHNAVEGRMDGRVARGTHECRQRRRGTSREHAYLKFSKLSVLGAAQVHKRAQETVRGTLGEKIESLCLGWSLSSLQNFSAPDGGLESRVMVDT